MDSLMPLKKNIDYESDGIVVLAVNTSWKAVGYYIYQETVDTKKKKTYVKFDSVVKFWTRPRKNIGWNDWKDHSVSR